MRRIVIDQDLCQGSQECAAIAGAAVTFDDDGVAVPVGDPLDDTLAERIVSTCPSMAITSVDS